MARGQTSRLWPLYLWAALLLGAVVWFWFVGREQMALSRLEHEGYPQQKVRAFLEWHPRSDEVGTVISGYLGVPTSAKIEELATYWRESTWLKHGDQIPDVVWAQVKERLFLNQVWAFALAFEGADEARQARELVAEKVAACDVRALDSYLLWREAVKVNDDLQEPLLRCLATLIPKGGVSPERLRGILVAAAESEAAPVAEARLAKVMEARFPFDRTGDQAVHALMLQHEGPGAPQVLLTHEVGSALSGAIPEDTRAAAQRRVEQRIKPYLRHLGLGLATERGEADAQWSVRWDLLDEVEGTDGTALSVAFRLQMVHNTGDELFQQSWQAALGEAETEASPGSDTGRHTDDAMTTAIDTLINSIEFAFNFEMAHVTAQQLRRELASSGE